MMEIHEFVDAVATDTGLMITGLKAGTATVVVWVGRRRRHAHAAGARMTPVLPRIDESMRAADTAAYVRSP